MAGRPRWVDTYHELRHPLDTHAVANTPTTLKIRLDGARVTVSCDGSEVARMHGSIKIEIDKGETRGGRSPAKPAREDGPLQVMD